MNKFKKFSLDLECCFYDYTGLSCKLKGGESIPEEACTLKNICLYIFVILVVLPTLLYSSGLHIVDFGVHTYIFYFHLGFYSLD